MIKQFACRVTFFLVKEKIIEAEKLVIYQFGIERFLKNIIVVLVITCMMIVYNTCAGTLFFFLGFIPMRRIAGGYHADSSIKCNLITIAIYGINIFFIYKMYGSLTYQKFGVIIFISIILIFKYAPVDHKNFIYNSLRTIEARKKSRKLIIFLSIISCLFIELFKGLNIISLSITMGAFTASVSILIGNIKRRREKNENESISK